MAAMTGSGDSATAVTDAWRRTISARAALALAADDAGAPEELPDGPTSPDMATRSSPTEKWGPLAATTTARISGSDPMAAIATGRSDQNAGPMALRFSGRSSQRVATCPSTSMERTSEEKEPRVGAGGGVINQSVDRPAAVRIRGALRFGWEVRNGQVVWVPRLVIGPPCARGPCSVHVHPGIRCRPARAALAAEAATPCPRGVHRGPAAQREG